MKRICPSILLMFFLITCSTGEKETSGQVTFYMINISGRWNLVLDGADKGNVKSTSQMPVCADPEFLTLTLSVGSHKYYLKSLDGYASGNSHNFSVNSGCHQLKCTE